MIIKKWTNSNSVANNAHTNIALSVLVKYVFVFLINNDTNLFKVAIQLR